MEITVTHSKRLDWFLKAYNKVREHPARKQDDLDYCVYLKSQCKTLKEIKQKMYEGFPFLKPESKRER